MSDNGERDYVQTTVSAWELQEDDIVLYMETPQAFYYSRRSPIKKILVTVEYEDGTRETVDQWEPFQVLRAIK